MAKAKSKSEAAVPAVVPESPQPPATVSQGGAGLEGFGTEDLVIPRMRIAQPTNRQGWRAGHFVETLSEEHFAELTEVVTLQVQKARVYFTPDSSDPLCASDDNIRPSARIERPQADLCAQCPKSQWSEGANGRRIKPPCSETWNFLIAKDGMPYFLSFHGAALSETKKLVTALVLRGKQKNLPAWGFRFDCGLKQVTFDQGVAFMPVFKNITALDADAVAEYGAMQAAFTERSVRVAPDADQDEPDTSFAFGKNVNA